MKSKSSANAGRSSDVIRPPISATVQTAVADSTSAISTRFSADAGKRKSDERDRNQLKKKKLDKRYNDSFVKKDISVIKPLMSIVIPKKTGVMYYHNNYFCIS